MRKSRKIIAFMTCAALVTAAGCGSSSKVTSQKRQVEISFSWWGNDARNKYTLAAINEFEKLHPDIKVDCNYSEWSGFETRNKVWMISGTESDVMQINYGWLTDYSSDGKGYYNLRELTEYLDISTFDEDSLRYGTTNQLLNALPIAMNTETVYINKTIYDKYGLSVPKTWDDLFAAAKAMKADGIYPLSASSKSMWLYLIAYTEQTLHKQILNEDGGLNFTASDFGVMIEFYKRLVDEKVMPQVERYERINLDNEMYAGSVAWVSDANSYFGDAVKNGREIVVADYTTAEGSAVGEGWYAKPATMYAVSKNTIHTKEAGLLLDFLVNSSQMAELQGIEKGIPMSSAAKAVLNNKGMLEGLQYEASQNMEGQQLSELSPVLENGGFIDDFFAASNNYLYRKDPEGIFQVIRLQEPFHSKGTALFRFTNRFYIKSLKKSAISGIISNRKYRLLPRF